MFLICLSIVMAVKLKSLGVFETQHIHTFLEQWNNWKKYVK